MARKRMLAPEFFTSVTVNQLSIPAMVTFAGLWCYADDYGRAEDDVVMVKATVWPRRKSHTEAKVAADLAQIADVGLICRYSVGGYPLLHVVSWHEHQKISHRGKASVAPCRSHEPAMWSEFKRADSGDGLDRFRRPSGDPPETLHDSVVKENLVKGSSREPSGTAPEVDAAKAKAREQIRAAS